MAAANAIAMTQQLNQKLPHLNPAKHQQQQQQHTQQVVHTHPLNISCNPGTNCFPLSSEFSTLSSHVGSQAASTVSESGHVTIAPKPLKPATHTASSFRSVPLDPERE
ncbi:hypothetical protein PsorP6_002804 [Peronosclerospora sorghi]|uniref:Uncharacterized protein n=1 Tax=Peronosclerospora sorghi TaxID=230839 RepID=A0ACC0VPM6_9STRA|nr:hypothetical protein PsorP6_002804 [Peronosclerospora sorghi]